MSTTNFFAQLAALQVEGDWTITIKAGTHNRMIVSVLFQNDKVGDNARKLIPPMILKGTTKELDNGFFTSIAQPVKQTAALFVNMEQYAKAQEAARLQSRMEKDKQDAAKKEKDTGSKKFEAAMKKVTEMEAAGKFREAYGQLPKPADFPEQQAAIDEKKQALLEKFEQPGLF
ncbi:MAG: PRTRC system protein E [Niabella sp.]